MVIVRQFTGANIKLLAGAEPELDPTSADNNLEMKWEAEQKKLHPMVKVHDFLVMWQYC
jgi:hypothetical protein